MAILLWMPASFGLRRQYLFLGWLLRLVRGSMVDRQPNSRNFSGPWRKTPDRLLGTSLIRLYQLTLSGFVGHSCRHLPTCSEYGYEAIARHGLWAGGWLALFRVARCGPGGTRGLDPVPETLAERYRWYLPWRYWSVGRHTV